jgi:hypothetical protein
VDVLDVPALGDRRLVAGGEKQLSGVVVGRSVSPIRYDQSCRYGFGSSISRESGSGSRVLMTKNRREKMQLKNLLSFLDQRLQFTYVQATGEAIGPRKKTSSTSKNEIY